MDAVTVSQLENGRWKIELVGAEIAADVLIDLGPSKTIYRYPSAAVSIDRHPDLDRRREAVRRVLHELGYLQRFDQNEALDQGANTGVQGAHTSPGRSDLPEPHANTSTRTPQTTPVPESAQTAADPLDRTDLR